MNIQVKYSDQFPVFFYITILTYNKNYEIQFNANRVNNVDNVASEILGCRYVRMWTSSCCQRISCPA
jgi:hypothetical protein